MNTKTIRILLILGLAFAGMLLLLDGSSEAAPTGPTNSTYFVEYPIPVDSSQPGAIAVEAPGRIWFTMPGTDQIGFLLVEAGGSHSFEFYSLPAGSDPYGITYDGQYIWYTTMGTGKLGRLDPAAPAGSATVEYSPPTASSGPADVGVAPDGRIWFTEMNASHIAVFDPQTQAFVEYPYTTKQGAQTAVVDIFVVNDDKILFTTPDEKQVVEFRPGNFGDPNLVAFTRFTVSDPSDFSVHRPGDVIVNEKGHVWISTPDRDALAERSDLTQQLWAFHILPSSGGHPTALASSADADYSTIWFVEPDGGRVGRFVKTASGKIVGFHERALPSTGSRPYDIAVDANAHAWISDRGANKIVRWLPPYDLSRTFLPTIMNRFDATLSEPIFGIQMYGATSETSRYAQPMVDSNASWLRVNVCWECIEPTNLPPESFDWASVDATLAAASFHDVNIIATIRTSPAWAAPYPEGPLYPDQLGEFAQFSRALVERYDGDGLADAPGSPVVRHWEYFNEPDAPFDHWAPGWGDRGAEYAQMLKTVYPAVKNADPAAQVLFGGIAYDYFEEYGGPFVYSFLDDVLAAGGGAYFDVMNFHYYPIFGHFWVTGDGLGLIEKTEYVRNRLRNYGLEKPIVITEAGWHSDGTADLASTPEIQARYVAALFVQSMAADVDSMIWWMLYDPGSNALANGLVTAAPDIEPKPSFTAFRTIVNQLSYAHYERALTAEETGNPAVEVHQFRDNVLRRTVYVTWLNPVETDETATLLLPTPAATVRDIYGNAHYVHSSDDGLLDGKITLQVGGRPLYVEVNW